MRHAEHVDMLQVVQPRTAEQTFGQDGIVIAGQQHDRHVGIGQHVSCALQHGL